MTKVEKCRNCNTILSDDLSYCPNCNWKKSRHVIPDDVEETIDVEDTDIENVDVEEVTDIKEKQVKEKQVQGRPSRKC